MHLILLSTNLTNLLNQLHLAHTSSLEECVLTTFCESYSSVVRTKLFYCSIYQMYVNDILTPIEGYETLHKELEEQYNSTFTSTDDSDSNTSLLWLLHLFSRLKEILLLSLIFAALSLPLITFFSGLLLIHVQKFSYSLFSLSNKLDQTLWPCLVIQFLYIILSTLHIILSTLHILLATYFKEEFLTHFYKAKGYSSTSYASHTNETYFSRQYDFLICQDIAKRIFKVLACCFKFVFIEHDCKQFLKELCTTVTRLVLSGKLITDIQEETRSIQCTDTTASYNDQCSALLLNDHTESTHHGSITNNHETACASNGVNVATKEIKQEAALLNSCNINSDDAKQSQHLIVQPKPTTHQLHNVNSLTKISTTFCVCENIYKKFHLQLTQLIINKITKDHW